MDNIELESNSIIQPKMPKNDDVTTLLTENLIAQQIKVDYQRQFDYWKVKQGTLDITLGGYANISKADIAFQTNFLQSIIQHFDTRESLCELACG